MEKKQEKMKMFIDIAMLVSLLFLMAYQITGDLFHEWIGMGMTVLVIIHQILNRKWYGTLFKGKQSPYRILSMVINVFLILSFFCDSCLRHVNVLSCRAVSLRDLETLICQKDASVTVSLVFCFDGASSGHASAIDPCKTEVWKETEDLRCRLIARRDSWPYPVFSKQDL